MVRERPTPQKSRRGYLQDDFQGVYRGISGASSQQTQQGFVLPKGVVHRTRAPERTVILMDENAGIVPTGN